MWTRVHTTYDSVGRRIRVQAYGDTTTAAQDSMTTGPQEWRYDGLGRVRWQRQGDKTDSMVYDLAGNVTELHTDRGHTITMEYDVLGRLKKRIVPQVTYTTVGGTIDSLPFYSEGKTIRADTVTYTYDALGNPLTINNHYAHITRTYTPDGRIATEQQALKNYGSGIYTNHVYDLGYTYNRDGQRLILHHPTWLSGGTDQTTYAFDGVGRVSTITDAGGNSFGYTYDNVDRVTQRTFPSGKTHWAYDDDNRLSNHGIEINTDTVLENTMNHDAVGRVTSIGGDGSGSTDYTGLGAVSQATNLAWEGPWKYEEFQMDPFGTQLRNVSLGGELEDDSIAFRNNVNIYGRITYTEEEWAWEEPDPDTPPNNWEPGWTTYTYDGSGNRSYTRQDRHAWYIDREAAGIGNAVKLVTYQEESKSFYSADQRLMVHQVNRDSIRYDTIWSTGPYEEGRWGAYEEYWYDGLGRRVLKRTRQDSPHCEITERCYSAIERYVWDGEQILWELRQANAGDTKNPGGGDQTGTIGYVHGTDVDAPLAMDRSGLVVLHQSWRGLYAFSTNASGGQTTCTPVPFGGCKSVAWPGGNGSTFMVNEVNETQHWYGSLSMDQRDATGLSYRRNRYYDPVSGQFTQSDPIGIAGGLNLYGYAGGDPINFSDPFGLCPWVWNPKCIEKAAVAAMESAVEGLGVITDAFVGFATSLVPAPLGKVLAGAVGATRGATAATRASGTLGRLSARLDNLMPTVDRAHLSAASAELRGAATGFDHVTEVRNSMNGLHNTIQSLNGVLANPNISAAERGLAQSMLSRASRALDAAEDIFNR